MKSRILMSLSMTGCFIKSHSFKFILLFFSCILVVGMHGCSSEKQSFSFIENDRLFSETAYWKISDWWEREAVYNYCFHGSDIALALKIDMLDIINTAKHLKNNFTYIEDTSDYWQTSLETEQSKKGDCEDFHIKLYIDLCKKGYPWDQIGIIIMFNSVTYKYHAVLCVYPDVFSKKAILISWDQIRIDTNYVPIFGFNLYQYWEYR
jgi:hypothetical protein